MKLNYDNRLALKGCLIVGAYHNAKPWSASNGGIPCAHHVHVEWMKAVLASTARVVSLALSLSWPWVGPDLSRKPMRRSCAKTAQRKPRSPCQTSPISRMRLGSCSAPSPKTKRGPQAAKLEARPLCTTPTWTPAFPRQEGLQVPACPSIKRT